MGKFTRVLLLFLFLGTIASQGLAQTFKYNTAPKGVKLPVQNIFQVEQDSLGRVWFSTSRGVFYSDGIQTYALPDSIYSNFDFQVSIHRDESGLVWLFNNSGLPKLLKGGYGTWEEVKVDFKLHEEPSTSIRFQTFGKEEEQIHFLETRYQFLFWKEGEKASAINRDLESAGRLISIEKIDGEFYGFFRNGTYRIHGDSLEQLKFDGLDLPTSPYLVKKAPDGQFYFLGEDYLAKGNQLAFPSEWLDRGFTKDYFFASNYYGLDFNKGSVFYHFNSPLQKLKMDQDSALELDLEFELNSFSIQDFLVDREGVLWMTTNRGLVNTNGLIFQNYGFWRSEMLGEEVTAIHKIQDGEFLFGFNNGIQRYSRYRLQTIYRDEYPEGIPTGRIINFAQGGKGEVWFSANWSGVGLVDVETNRVQTFRAPDDITISSVQVVGGMLIAAGPRAIYKVPVSTRGVQIFEKNLVSQAEKLLGDSFFYLRKASLLSDGRMIVLRASKLDNPKPVVENEDLLIAEGYDFLETEEGLLLGTEGGVKVWDGAQLRPYFVGGGAIDRPVFVLIKDSAGGIWAGTDDGIYGLIDDEIFHYNESNGLIANETNRGALVEADSSSLLIGTVRGFSMFYRSEDFLASGSPKVSFSKIRIGETALNNEKLIVPNEQNSMEVDFSAVGFNEQEPLWVHYRLLGLSDEWEINKDPKSATLFFGNLPPGDYQFELKASYGGMNFSETISSVPFRVLKPFYLRAWFLTLLAAVFVGIGILINILFRQLQKVGLLETAFDQSDKEKVFLEQQFKNVWNSSKDGLALSYDGETIIAANPALANWLRIEKEELSGKKFKDLIFSHVDNDSFFKRFQEGMANIDEMGFEMEASLVLPEGKFELALFNRLIQDGGVSEKKVILTVLRDITSEKAIETKLREAKEEAEQANRFKTSLLSNVSHEIRTPLNGIIGGTEHIMMTQQEDKKLLGQLDIILQSGERLLQTINSILDMAKIEANKMEVVYSPTLIKTFIEQLLKSYQPLAFKKGLEINAVLPKEDSEILIDRRFTEMILNNVIGNAIKYSGKGTIGLEVDVSKNQLGLEIIDQGVGMSEAFLKRIFDPFEQESTGHQRQFEGTGLGMSITRHLVDLLGGKILIDSKKGKGTRVRIEIPLPNS